MRSGTLAFADRKPDVHDLRFDLTSFGALDDENVDLIFLLLAPEQAGADHLKALARISRLLREPTTIEKLRAAKDRAALYAVLTAPAASHAA